MGDCFLLGLRLVRSSVPVHMLAVAVVVVGWPFDPLLVGPLAEHEMKYVPMVGKAFCTWVRLMHVVDGRMQLRLLPNCSPGSEPIPGLQAKFETAVG